MSVRRVKVMADYGDPFPVWGAGVRPSALPLTDSLRHDLEQWSSDYGQILTGNGHNWPDEQIREDSNERGRALAVRVARELDGAYEVVFFDEMKGHVVELPGTEI